MACIAEPDIVDLCRRRGDTFPDQFTVRSVRADGTAGSAIDITGFSFLLTVDPTEFPTDALGNLFQLTGVIVDAPAGKVEFAPTAVESDQTPASYFYDVQMTDTGGAIRTISVGPYVITQDITK